MVPESFTHGSAAQRMAALKRGLSTGDPAACNYASQERLAPRPVFVIPANDVPLHGKVVALTA